MTLKWLSNLWHVLQIDYFRIHFDWMSHLQICKKIHKNKYNATNTPMTAHFIFIQQVNHWFCLITTGSSNNITSRIYLAWLGMSERVSPKHYIKTSKAWHVSSVLKHNLQYLGKTAIYWQRKLLTPTVNHFPVGWPLWVKRIMQTSPHVIYWQKKNLLNIYPV